MGSERHEVGPGSLCDLSCSFAAIKYPVLVASPARSKPVKPVCRLLGATRSPITDSQSKIWRDRPFPFAAGHHIERVFFFAKLPGDRFPNLGPGPGLPLVLRCLDLLAGTGTLRGGTQAPATGGDRRGRNGNHREHALRGLCRGNRLWAGRACLHRTGPFSDSRNYPV